MHVQTDPEGASDFICLNSHRLCVTAIVRQEVLSTVENVGLELFSNKSSTTLENPYFGI